MHFFIIGIMTGEKGIDFFFNKWQLQVIIILNAHNIYYWRNVFYKIKLTLLLYGCYQHLWPDRNTNFFNKELIING